MINSYKKGKRKNNVKFVASAEQSAKPSHTCQNIPSRMRKTRTARTGSLNTAKGTSRIAVDRKRPIREATTALGRLC